MLKFFKQKNNINNAICLSIILHCIFITILVYKTANKSTEIFSFQEKKENQLIKIIIIDPNLITKQYDYQKKIKRLKQKSLEINKYTYKQNCPSKRKGIVNIKVKNKSDVSSVKKITNFNNKKKLLEEINNQSIYVEDLINKLSDTKNTPKDIIFPDNRKNINQKINLASDAEIDSYKEVINNAIKSKFYDYTSFSGKTCDLHIKLAPNGALISIRASKGDAALCKAAISAANSANIPNPPSTKVYEIFKNITLKFTPK